MVWSRLLPRTMRRRRTFWSSSLSSSFWALLIFKVEGIPNISFMRCNFKSLSLPPQNMPSEISSDSIKWSLQLASFALISTLPPYPHIPGEHPRESIFEGPLQLPSLSLSHPALPYSLDVYQTPAHTQASCKCRITD